MKVTRAVPKPLPKVKSPRPIPRVNKERKERRFRETYGLKGEWIRRQPCCCCGLWNGALLGRTRLIQIVAAHFPSRGAGGTAKHLVPLAAHLHEWAHQHGEKALERRFGVNFRELAKEYEARWQAVQRRSAE